MKQVISKETGISVGIVMTALAAMFYAGWNTAMLKKDFDNHKLIHMHEGARIEFEKYVTYKEFDANQRRLDKRLDQIIATQERILLLLPNNGGIRSNN